MVNVGIVTSGDIKVYYTGKFQDFTARYIIKGDIARKKQVSFFLIFPPFLIVSVNFPPFQLHFKLLSENSFSLRQSKISSLTKCQNN